MICRGMNDIGECIAYPFLGRLRTPAATCAVCRINGGWPHPDLDADPDQHCAHRTDTGERVSETCACTWIICHYPDHGEIKPRLNSRQCNQTCKLYSEAPA